MPLMSPLLVPKEMLSGWRLVLFTWLPCSTNEVQDSRWQQQEALFNPKNCLSNPLPLSARIFDVLDCPVQLPSKCPLYISVLGGSWGKPTHCPFSEVESDSSRRQWLQLFHRIRSASSATVSTSLSSMQSTPICCKTCHCCTAPKFPDFPTLTLLPIDIYWLSKFAAGFSHRHRLRLHEVSNAALCHHLKCCIMFRGIWWSKSDLENEFQLAHPFCNLLWLVWLACVTSNLYFFPATSNP